MWRPGFTFELNFWPHITGKQVIRFGDGWVHEPQVTTAAPDASR
jgi:hypothetical protein